MAAPGVKEDPYPAKSQTTSGVVGGIATEVSSTSYSDRILVTISQEGRLSQWVQVPLASSAAGISDMAMPSNGHLPAAHLTPRTLLGGGGEERETNGQLYAAQIANHLLLRYPNESRLLVVGFGLAEISKEREAFFDLFELVQTVL